MNSNNYLLTGNNFPCNFTKMNLRFYFQFVEIKALFHLVEIKALF